MSGLGGRRSRIRGCSAWAAFMGWTALLIGLAAPALAENTAPDLIDRSLEDLMNIEVTSVSKTEQTIARTAAAVFVITADDIQRSGATDIPDLLRMVPGLDVAEINANTWAVSVRGLNGRFSNKLLVILDGRNVYTPTFGGVFWDVLDLPLEDIERIEVIRGPGGTVWGADAVNGVVNIMSRKTAANRGGMAVGGGGNLDKGFGTVQYGDAIGKSSNYRIFAKYFDQNHMLGVNGSDGGDSWHLSRVGFRTDTTLSAKDSLTVEGDVYGGEEGSLIPLASLHQASPSVRLSGGFLQSTWEHVFSPRSDTTLQVSFDRYKRDDQLMERRRTLDVDFQNHFAWGARQDIIWGANYRNTDSDTHGDLELSLRPADVNMQLFSLFIQDELALVPDKVYLTAGTRLDHNYYTGLSFLPSVRVSWTSSSRCMFWAATSRAERMPAETDTSANISLGGSTGADGVPVQAVLMGNPHFQNERLVAYEAGFRVAAGQRLSVDLPIYYNRYSSLETSEPGVPLFETAPAPPHLLLPITYGNLMQGEAHGLEIAGNWKATERWTLSPGYAFEQIHMHLDPASKDTSSVLNGEGSSPVHGAQLRSHVDLTNGLAWNASAYFADRLKSGAVPSYTRLDTGLTWRWTEKLWLDVVGQNLLQNRHLEFVDETESLRSSLIKRGAYAKVTWEF